MEKQIKFVQVSADNAENCKVYESLMYEYIDEMNEHSERPLPKEFQQKWTNSIIAMQGPTERSFSAFVMAIFLRTLKPLTILLLQHMQRTLPYRRDFAGIPYRHVPGQCSSARVQCQMRSKMYGTRLSRSFSRHRATSPPMKWILRHIAKETWAIRIITVKSGFLL